MGNSPNSAIDFILTLGAYYGARLSEAWSRMVSGFSPLAPKTIASGAFGVLYLIAVVAFMGWLLYNGFMRHPRINFSLVAALTVMFALSFLK